MIFSAESIRAIRAGTKTQTRRVIEPQPPAGTTSIKPSLTNTTWVVYHGERGLREIVCEHGGEGDGWWVREPTRRTADGFTQYVVDEVTVSRRWPATAKKHYHLARWMPRELCRLGLVILRVRAELLQDINDADIHAEGAESRPGFRRAWDLLNSHRGFTYSSNPWVWAFNFAERKDISHGGF
jgi:hypothetical protein